MVANKFKCLDVRISYTNALASAKRAVAILKRIRMCPIDGDDARSLGRMLVVVVIQGILSGSFGMF